MNARKIASRVVTAYSGRLEERYDYGSSGVDPTFSCDFQINLSATIKGTVDKGILSKKLEREFLAAYQGALKIAARELSLEITSVEVRPLELNVVESEHGK